MKKILCLAIALGFGSMVLGCGGEPEKPAAPAKPAAEGEKKPAEGEKK